MQPDSLALYLIAVFALLLKYVFAVGVQGITRVRSRSFRWPEDAKANRGEVGEKEPEVVHRAQRLIDNEGESQPYFLVFGAAFVFTGGAAGWAMAYFLTYASARLVHGALMMKPSQPLRTLVFSVGMVTLLALSVHTLLQAAALRV